jgi:integrase
MPVSLDDRYIRSLKPGTKRANLQDSLVPGLMLRLTPTGGRSFAVWYRVAGRSRLITLGPYRSADARGAGLTLKEARDEAQRVLSRVKLGGDPQDEKIQRRRKEKEARQAKAKAVNTTIEAITNRCLDDLTLRPSTSREWRRLAKVEIVPTFGRLQASALTRAAIREWGESVAERSAYTGNRAFEVLRRVFSWAVGKDILAASPFVGLQKPGREEQSHRVLAEGELAALLVALDDVDERDYADALRLLLLTAVRRAMVLGMSRDELLDLDGDEPRWVIPGGFEGRSKSGRPHVVPLSPEALRIVRHRLETASGKFLFPVTRLGRARDGRAKSATLTWSSRFMDDLRAKAKEHFAGDMPAWRVHDIRHAVATHLRERFKVSSEVVSMVLGHTPPGAPVSRVYNRAELLPERRAALNTWAVWLEELHEKKLQDEGRRAACVR